MLIFVLKIQYYRVYKKNYLPLKKPQNTIVETISDTKKHAIVLSVAKTPPANIIGRTPYFWPNIPTTGPEIKEFRTSNFIIDIIRKEKGVPEKYLRI